MSVILLTGLPGSGKTTLAKKLKEELEKRGKKVVILDGNEIRAKFYPELGFSKEEREFHNKVCIFLAKFLSEELGYTVILSLIAPIKKVREYAKQKIKNLLIVYLKCPIEILKQRKPEIYKDPSAVFYEEGEYDLVIETDKISIEEAVKKILENFK